MGRLTSLRKSLNKKNYVTEMSDPTCWVGWGNMSMNYYCTGSFTRGIPNKRVVMLYGPSGTGKSLFTAKTMRECQDAGYMVICIDTEGAMDREYLTKVGVDLDEDKYLPIRAISIEEIADITSEIFREFGKDEKIALFIDSLGMVDTDDRNEAFDKKGEMKNDMGLLAKKIKHLTKNLCRKATERDMFCVVVQHAYQNQNVMNGEGTHVPSGGEAQVFIPSISILLRRLKLKEGTESVGVKIKGEIKKTRFSKLGSTFELEVPYSTGVDLYDGVLDILEKLGAVSRSGAWYSYEKDGEVVKFQKKNSQEHVDYLVKLVEPDIIEENDEA